MDQVRHFESGPASRWHGLWSELSFGWVSPLIARSVVHSRDIWELPADLQAGVIAPRAKALWDAQCRQAGAGQPSLLGLLLSMTARPIALSVVANLVFAAGEIGKPLLLRELLRELEAGAAESGTRLYVLCALVCASCLLAGLAQGLYFFRARLRAGAQLQCILISLVTAKALRMSALMGGAGGAPSSQGEGGAGGAAREGGGGESAPTTTRAGAEASAAAEHGEQGRAAAPRVAEINLVSSDAFAMLDACHWCLRLPGYLIMIIVAIGMLFTELRLGTLCGLAVLLLVITLQWWLGSLQSRLTHRKQERTDGRLRMLRQVLTSIRVLKVFAWEGHFGGQVTSLRAREMRFVRAYRVAWAVNQLLSNAVIVLVALAGIGGYSLMYSAPLTASTVFSSLALFNLLRQPLAFVPMVAGALVKAGVAVRRVER